MLWSDAPNFSPAVSMLQPLGWKSLCRKCFWAIAYAALLVCQSFQVVSDLVRDYYYYFVSVPLPIMYMCDSRCKVPYGGNYFWCLSPAWLAEKIKIKKVFGFLVKIQPCEFISFLKVLCTLCRLVVFVSVYFRVQTFTPLLFGLYYSFVKTKSNTVEISS